MLDSTTPREEPVYWASNCATASKPPRVLRISNGGAVPLLSELADAFVAQCATPTAIGIQQNISPATLALLAAGETDIALTHERDQEAPFLESGDFELLGPPIFGIYLLLVGPVSNPASILETDSIATAFWKLARAMHAGQAAFHSRGDDSVTHCLEQACWALAGYEPDKLPNYKRTHLFPADAVLEADQSQSYSFLALHNFAEVKVSSLKVYLTCARSACNALIRTGGDTRLAREFYDWIQEDGSHIIETFPSAEAPVYFCPSQQL